MADRETIIDRVKALWTQANHPNTGAAEAEAFRLKAADLMARYEIDEMVLSENGKIDNKLVVVNIRLSTECVPGEFDEQQMALLHVIAQAHDVAGIILNKYSSFNDEYDKGKLKAPGRFYQAIGFDHDVDMVRMLYASLNTDVMVAVLRLRESKKNLNYCRNFIIGYVDGIKARLAEMTRARKRVAQEHSTSMALALVDKSQQVKAYQAQLHPNMGTYHTRSQRVDGAAQYAGQQRAKQADLGGDNRVTSGSRKELH